MQNKYTPQTLMLKALRNSHTLKIKNGWIRETGAGFIADDILKIVYNPNKTLTIYFNWPHQQTFKTAELNLRETEEAIKFIENPFETCQKCKVRAVYMPQTKTLRCPVCGGET